MRLSIYSVGTQPTTVPEDSQNIISNHLKPVNCFFNVFYIFLQFAGNLILPSEIRVLKRCGVPTMSRQYNKEQLNYNINSTKLCRKNLHYPYWT